MKKYIKKSGMALITVLMVLILLVMIITALVALNSNNLFYTLNYVNNATALSLCEAGVSYAIYTMGQNPAWEEDNFIYNMETGKFTITFDKSDDYFSCNNLTGKAMKTGYKNLSVYPSTADLIVSGYTGNTVKRLRVTVGRDSVKEAGKCTGIADINANIFELTREITPMDSSKSGKFHSNSSNITAIGTNDTEVYAYGGTISAVGGINIPEYDEENNTEIISNSAPKPVPDMNIIEIVDSKSGVNNTPGGIYTIRQEKSGDPFKIYRNGVELSTPVAGTRLEEDGTLVFTEDVHFDSDVKFEFLMEDNYYKEAGIRLEKKDDATPSIYVNGTDKEQSFWVLGKVVGDGAIATKGGTKFIMQTDVTGDEHSGVVLLSEGNVNVKLPASRLSTIDLSLTGAVLTHGNLKGTIMDIYDPDNPFNQSGWPEDWVEISYDGTGSTTYGLNVPNTTQAAQAGAVEGDGKYGNLPYYWPNIAPPGDTDDGWTLLFQPQNDNNVAAPVTLNPNGDGTYSISSNPNPENPSLPATHVHLRFYKNEDDAGWNAHNFNVIPLPSTTGENYAFGPGSVPPSWNIKDPYGKLTPEEFYQYILDSFNIQCGGTNGEGGVTETLVDLYGPDVSIKGALVVADPNNLDGKGPANSSAGNINIDLISSQNVPVKEKGSFHISHSKNYEKLLAENYTKLVVKTWEILQ